MVDALDALDNYLVWELCKQRDIRRRIMEGSAGGEELKKEVVEKAREEYHGDNYDFEEKKVLLKKLDSNPEYRIEVFDEHSWKRKDVSIEDLGTTLPRAGDLPPEVITGSLPEVLRFVKNADPEKYQSVKYIHRLKKVPEILNEFFPWVLTPGNRPEKLDRMNKVHGEKDWIIENTWGIINDGNHRTIAKILADDLEEIEYFVGRPENYE